MRAGLGGLIICGAFAGPVAGGQLALLAKPFGGVVGVPGAVIGYLAVAAFVLGCVTAAIVGARSMRTAGAFGVVAGLGFVVAGLVSTPWMFTVAVLVAGAGTGPAFANGRVRALAGGARLLASWHLVTVVGVIVAAGIAALCERTPGTGLLVSGMMAAVCAVVAVIAATDGSAAGTTPGAALEPQPAPASVSMSMSKPDRASVLDRGAASVLDPGPASVPNPGPAPVPVPTAAPSPVRSALGYSTVGLLVGGTVLPALHLLLFRWNAVGSEQAVWLALAALPAVIVVALPGPDSSAVVPLLILAAGGPVLVATAPGAVTLAAGVAVSLAAAARAARGLDSEICSATGSSVGAESYRRAGVATVLVAATAALAGMGLVGGVSRLAGTGSGLVVLAAVGLVGALLCGRFATRSVGAEPVYQGGTP
ncbi:hypothetical protein [Nocardia sp. NPDC051832]|uniref:hypothetical protein n=1 Tax=Nocardia sp. NPDC051832 TaxID=3155673 RepID=UPI00344175FB